jgi:BASS family bile acid:Na+ symporter
MNTDNSIIIPLAIALIMLGIGFNIHFGALRSVFTRPKGILTGLFCQMLLLPVTAFLIALAFPIDPVYKVGLVLVAACPGGTASNLVTHLLKGRIALSVSLTSFNSFLIIFTVPLLISLALNTFMGEGAEISLSLYDTFREVFLTVIIPTLIGMTVNYYFPNFTNRLQKPLRYVLPLLLLVVFIIAAKGDTGQVNFKERLFEHLDLLLPSFLLNLSGILIGYRIGRIVGITHGGSYTIAIEMGLQNSALAIFIATQLLNDSDIALMAIIYSSFTFFSTIGFAYMLKEHITLVQLFRNIYIKIYGKNRRL